jgi:ABC transporter fused permease/ATP-binding protein
MARHSYSRQNQGRDDAPPTKLSRQTLREAAGLFGYLWPYRYKFALALVILFVSNLMFLTLPLMFGNLVDSASLGKEGPFRPPLIKLDVNTTGIVLLCILAVQAACAFGHSVLFASVGERSLADLRHDTYARLIRLPMSFFAQRRVGELTSRLSSDLAQIQDTLIMTLPHLIRQTTILVGGIILIAATSWQLTLVMLASLPVIIVIAAIFGRLIRKTSRDTQDKLADTSVVVEETLQGIANVKAFTNESYEQQRYQGGLQTFLVMALRAARYRAGFISFIIFCLFGAIVVVAWYGAHLLQSGALSTGELASFMLYTMFVGGAMGSFAELYTQLQRTIGASQRVRELLREQPEPLILPAPALNGTVAPPLSGPSVDGHRKLRGDVVFEKVEFSYPSRKDVQVLKGVSLDARAGERIALVGPSGAGKSTIVSLLLRFYDPDAGRIVIGGRDAREYGLMELRSQMALVPQDVFLFGGTIAENIGYGKPGSPQDEIETAARQANAHDFIVSFPEGYQTLVGERGVQLSGGQRQRVAIARAILKDPAILLLDEATSSLDSESESLVQQALEVLMRGRTSVIIAHRLATVRTADKIYVIKEGQTVESGTHTELIERQDGLYRTLSELQFDLH